MSTDSKNALIEKWMALAGELMAQIDNMESDAIRGLRDEHNKRRAGRKGGRTSRRLKVCAVCARRYLKSKHKPQSAWWTTATNLAGKHFEVSGQHVRNLVPDLKPHFKHRKTRSPQL